MFSERVAPKFGMMIVAFSTSWGVAAISARARVEKAGQETVGEVHTALWIGADSSPSVTAANPTPCDAESDCGDQNGCTVDRCVNGLCTFDVIANCVPCQSSLLCPPVDLVFLMDTSGSMMDDSAWLCESIARLIDDLDAEGVRVQSTILGITEHPSSVFPCLMDDVVRRFGAAVPGESGSCSFPNGPSAVESWGPATAIVAERFPWRSGSVRVLVPMSDEGPCSGGSSIGCNDPGDDRASVNNAAAVAWENGVMVFPVLAGVDGCVTVLARDLAAATGGVAAGSGAAKEHLQAEILSRLGDLCEALEDCDDADPCTTKDRCAGGICTGVRVDGCRRCSLSLDCRDSNACTVDQCRDGACTRDLIAGCIPCVHASGCNDGNACTANSCENGVCVFRPSFAVGVECCNPRTGVRMLIVDGNVCTTESCDSATGTVSRAVAGFGVACDDGADCTIGDRCDGAGRCAGLDLRSIECSRDSECSPYLCDPETGACLCDPDPFLTLEALRPVEKNCLGVGDAVAVTISVGAGPSLLAAGQFLVEFDPQVLRFVSAEPGRSANPSSPFSLEIFEDTSLAASGRVFYAVGVPLFSPGAPGPEVLAVLRFTARVPCRATPLCFVDENPRHTRLSDPFGIEIPVHHRCTTVAVGDGPPVLQCPSSLEVNAAAGRLTADVFWNEPTAVGGCGTVLLECAGRHEEGADVGNFAGTGGRLPGGRSDFDCVAWDECGFNARCSWSVNVLKQNLLEMNLELLPHSAGGELRRCIEFEVYADCGIEPEILSADVSFGPPSGLPGRASGVLLSVPAGDYSCIAARDPAHTVRSVAPLVIRDGRYVANFLGDPKTGGNGLFGGDLNASGSVDFHDFSVWLGQYLTRRPVQSICGSQARNADLNGDGTVDSIDFAIVYDRYLQVSEQRCCP